MLKVKFICELTWSQKHRKTATNTSYTCYPLHLQPQQALASSSQALHPTRGLSLPVVCPASRPSSPGKGPARVQAATLPHTLGWFLREGYLLCQGLYPTHCSEHAACNRRRGFVGKHQTFSTWMPEVWFMGASHQRDLERWWALTKPRQGSSTREYRDTSLAPESLLRYIKYKPAQPRTGTFRSSLPP